MSKRIDYTGRRFGKLTVVGFNEDTKQWICKCDCGNTVLYTSRQLRANKPKSCGCLRSPDLTGKRFGRLVAIEKTDKRDDNYNQYWLCKCDCGNYKEVTATSLNKGDVKSCGCLIDERQKINGEKLGNWTIENHVIDNTNVANLTSKLSKRNTSGYRGVSWDKAKKLWRAQIRFKNISYHLGYYADKMDAVKTRQKAEEKLFGNFLDWYENEYKKSKKEED